MEEKKDLQEISKSFIKKIKDSDRFLIICSAPIDDDSLASALIIKWILEKLGKTNITLVTFFFIPKYLEEKFETKSHFKFVSIYNLDYSDYDCIIGVDANAWSQLFTSKTPDFDSFKTLLNNQIEKFIHIDHHPEAEIKGDISSQSLTKPESCTAKVIYDYLIKPLNLMLDSYIAQLIYTALVYDTGRFLHAIYKDTFDFVSLLNNFDIDHDKAVDIAIPKLQIDYMSIALRNLQYYPNEHLTILPITKEVIEEIKKDLGEDWKHNRAHYYFHETIPRRIEGYDYHLTFSFDEKKNGVDIAWRVRNLEIDSRIEILPILETIGAKGGGHLGAGGAFIANKSVEEISEEFIKLFREKLNLPLNTTNI